MNKSIRNTLLVIAVLFAGSQVAMADQAQNEMLLKAFENAGITAGSLDVNVQDGVATISGNVENSVDQEHILQVAKSTSGITEVIDLTTTH